MREKIKKLLKSDASRFIIPKFSFKEALLFQYIFTFGFFEYVVHGGLRGPGFSPKVNAIASLDYFLDFFAILSTIIFVGYLIYLSIIALRDINPPKTIKIIIALFMTTFLSLISLENASNILTKNPPNNLYGIYIYILSLYFLCIAIIKIVIMFSTLSKRYNSDKWLVLSNEEIEEKMINHTVRKTTFFAIFLLSPLIYFGLRSGGTLSFSILHTYFYALILTKTVNRFSAY